MLKRRDSLLMKLIRVSAFLLFSQAILTALAVRHVRAEVQNLMMSMGAQVMQLGERMGAGPPRTLRINGAQIRLRVDRAPGLRLKEVMDHFEAVCRSRNGRFHEQLTTRKTKVPLNDAELGFLDGVMRVDDDDKGSVACMDVGTEEASPSTILQRAQRFAATGDASAFGELRYVRAEREGDGVFVVMMWTDGPLNLRKMFPDEGDAPGVDFPDLPRPPHSRRILSAWEEGQAPAINIYETPRMDAAALDTHYRLALPSHGWEALTPPTAQVDAKLRGMMAMRDGVTVTLTYASFDRGRHGMTTIAPMDTKGATSSSLPSDGS